MFGGNILSRMLGPGRKPESPAELKLADQATNEIKPQEIHIVCGPSSAGKSTFIDRYLDGIGDEKMLLASDVERGIDVSEANVVHYNTLRAIDHFLDSWENGSSLAYSRQIAETDFSADPAWRAILGSKSNFRCTLILTPEIDIWKRASKRVLIEPEHKEKHVYPQKRWLAHYRLLDLEQHYRMWVEELRNRGMTFTVVDGSSPEFTEVEDIEEALCKVNMDLTAVSDDELVLFSGAGDITYQCVDFRETSTIRGADAQEMFDRVLPGSLEGKKFLDVGCAEGTFCLEAKRRGAVVVKGIDIKANRLGIAKTLARARGVEAQFELRDIQRTPINEDYDHIIILNVIHHLDQPFQVLKNLAKSTLETLVIEFPGLSDHKFGRTVPGLPTGLNGFPLIGVSLIGEQDQTFVYSPAAIERLMSGPPYSFAKVQIRPSPMNQRFFAVCER